MYGSRKIYIVGLSSIEDGIERYTHVVTTQRDLWEYIARGQKFGGMSVSLHTTDASLKEFDHLDDVVVFDSDPEVRRRAEYEIPHATILPYDQPEEVLDMLRLL
ncbi:MAG: hypothetical protein KKG59_03205 [Nanoarchaeota archaeon]|nr:hypothetical protein [Nanoarchaeota archaeon]